MTAKRAAKIAILFFCFAEILCFDTASGQNIVDANSSTFAANPVKLTETEFSEFIFSAPDLGAPANRNASPRLRQRLDQHVAQFLGGFPWKAFHHTLGISGYEVYFDHPDEMFYALSLALPWLSDGNAARTRAFLKAQLEEHPPSAVDGFDRLRGKPRESYDVPEELRLRGRGQAPSAFGVYAFWAYCQAAADTNAASAHWPIIRKRLQSLLEKPYSFDIHEKNYSHDEAQKLNGDLAGLIAGARLARLNQDTAAEARMVQRAGELLELRINLERVNPQILAKTSSSSKHLHHFKLARYCDLVPEVGKALSKLTDGAAVAHLKSFREERNGWYLAFGDRLIGGENYTNPLHFPRALFAGAALVEQLPPKELASFVDVPWGKGDLYFIEKCALALRAAQGQNSSAPAQGNP